MKLESYAGKCPDIEGSGGKTHSKGITHVRNKFLSNAVYESAISLVMNKNKEFYDIFNREIGKKKSNVQAYIVVAKRLLFHIYSIMKNHKPYKEKMVGNYKRGYVVRTLYYLDSYQVEYIEIDKYKLKYNGVV